MKQLMKNFLTDFTSFRKGRSKSLKFKTKNRRVKHKGFTLVEVLVALVISGMLLASVMGSFWVLMRANQRAQISRELQKETNFAIIRMADTIRNFAIDYEAYQFGTGSICESLDINNCQNLCIKENEFEHKDENLFMNGQPLFSAKHKVENVYFSIAPSQNPFENLGDRQKQIQPRATIFIHVVSKNDPAIELEIQTTISSRKYKK